MDAFKKQVKLLCQSGVGVIVARSREPYRVMEALKEMAFVDAMYDKTFRQWDIVRGWVSPNLSRPDADPHIEKIEHPYMALKRIDDLDGSGESAWKKGMFAMMGLHNFFDKMPGIVECLRQYVWRFSTTDQKLILVMPEDFTVPTELQHDIPVVDSALPEREELRTVLDSVVRASQPDDATRKELSAVFTDRQLDTLLSLSSGMTQQEAEIAFSKAVADNWDTWPTTKFSKFASMVMVTKTDVVKRSEVLELMDAGSMKEVGGMDHLKEWIVKRKSAFSKEARESGIDSPKGCILIGPPGTGKTLAGKAIASVLSLPCVKVDISRVFGSYIGQSEGRMRSCLLQLAAMAPCVAIVDEVDKAGLDPRQGSGDSGVGKRVLGAILTFMQESKAEVFWVFTANRVSSLPPELLRKGRMDEAWAVMLPNKIERMEILRIHLRKRKRNPDDIADLAKAVRASKGYVAAEIEAAVKEAVINAWDSDTEVSGKSIARELDNMRPISIAFKDDFDEMTRWASNNARWASTKDDDDDNDEEDDDAPATETRPRRRRITR